MNVGFYEAAASMGTLERLQDVISDNLSASSSIGFKKALSSINSRERGMMESETATRFAALMPGNSTELKTKVDYSEGSMIRTDKPTDVAIQGDGFFELEDHEGETVYTRDGQFHINHEGYLVNTNGFMVQGDTGPIQLVPGTGEVAIDSEGIVTQGGVSRGTLNVVGFQNPDALSRLGSFFRESPQAEAQPQLLENVTVLQGHIEGSNVSAIQEMVNMITLSRAYEANHKVIREFDDRTDKAIQTLGNTR